MVEQPADGRALASRASQDEVLEDDFSSNYLLQYSESEFSSENVAFLLELRKVQKLSASDTDANALSQQICNTHVVVGAHLEVNLPPDLRNILMQWLKASQSDKRVSQPLTGQSRS